MRTQVCALTCVVSCGARASLWATRRRCAPRPLLARVVARRTPRRSESDRARLECVLARRALGPLPPAWRRGPGQGTPRAGCRRERAPAACSRGGLAARRAVATIARSCDALCASPCDRRPRGWLGPWLLAAAQCTAQCATPALPPRLACAGPSVEGGDGDVWAARMAARLCSVRRTASMPADAAQLAG